MKWNVEFEIKLDNIVQHVELENNGFHILNHMDC